MTREELDRVKEKIAKYKTDSQMVENLGGFSEERVASDKVGFDWVNRYLGDVLVSQTYVEQENPAGTADNPIVWKAGMTLIQNAYYIYDGVRKVWMGEADAAADSFDDEGFVEF